MKNFNMMNENMNKLHCVSASGSDEVNTSRIAICPVCQQVASKKCSGCHKVSYCSSDHQKKHWRIHKNECRIFTVKRNDVYGRFLVAARDIPQGTVIFTEDPLTVGPKRSTFPVCLGCHTLVDGKYRCSKCTYPMCSEICEQAPIHAENECTVFQRAAHPVGSKISNFEVACPAYESITPIRCLMLKDRDPSKWERLITMEHHNEIRKSIPGLWNRNHVNVVKLLLEWCKLKEEFDEDTLHSVMGYIDVNCFEIKYQGVVICGVYQLAGLMSHSCVPNSHTAINSQHKMIVRSSTPIKKGEMITNSYTNNLNGTRERRLFLKETKYFDCLCTRCNSASEFSTYLSAIKCTDCPTGYLLPKDPINDTLTDWSCTNTSEDKDVNNTEGVAPNKFSNGNGSYHCTKTLKEEQVQAILKKVRKDIDEVSRSSSGSPVSRLERLLKKYSGKILHPNHFLLLDVIKSLNYSYAAFNETTNADSEAYNGKDESGLDHLTRAKSLCQQLLSILDMIDPGLTRLRGVTLFQMSLAEFKISRFKLKRRDISEKEYKNTLENILAYLKTSRDIIELDKFVSPNAVLYSRILEHTAMIQDAYNS